MTKQEKEYLTFEEAADYIGVRRSTLYTLMAELRITSRKFRLNKRKYLALTDVKRMKEVRERPWLAEQKLTSDDAA